MCEFGSVRAEEEDEMAKWQRWERGVQRCDYKALPPPFHIRGFLGNRSHDLCFSKFSTTEGGPLPGPSHNPGSYHRFIFAICYGSPNIHQHLRQPLRLSNITAQPSLWFFLDDSVFSKMTVVSDPGTTCLRHLLLGSGTKWAHFTLR